MYRLLTHAIALAVVFCAVPGHVTAAESVADETVAGRLGGTLQSFSDRFGEPLGVNEAAGAAFTAEGFGRIFVQVDHVQGTANDDGRARSIVAGAPRPAGLSATQPDAADWPVDVALERARSLLPTDTELSEFTIAGADGQLAATCQSDALQELFGVLTLGQCRVSFVQPQPETVSFITLALITGSALEGDGLPLANPCEEAVSWIHRAGERLVLSQALLETVATTDETDPGAPESLRTTAASFAQLAEAQRNDVPPAAAAAAGETLTASFATYAEAVSAAANGLDDDDPALIQQAVDGIENASSLAADATDQLEEVVSACGLVIGDPATPASIP